MYTSSRPESPDMCGEHVPEDVSQQSEALLEVLGPLPPLVPSYVAYSPTYGVLDSIVT